MSIKLFRTISIFIVAITCCVSTYYFLKKPYFSIIVCSYNYGHFLEQTVESVLNSTFKNYELIIVNDGSTDNTSEILKKYQNHPKITIIEHENMGLSLSRNKAMKIAKGKYFWFVDADDWIDKKALERLYKKTKNKDLDVVTFNIGAVSEKGDFLGVSGYNGLPVRFLIDLKLKSEKSFYTIDNFLVKELLSFPVTSGKQIYRREFIQKNKIDFPARTLFEDDVFFLHTIFAGAKISFIKEVLYYKRSHGQAITADKAKHFDSFVRICMYIWNRTHLFPQNEEKATAVSNSYISSIPTRWNTLTQERKYKFYPELLKFKHFADSQPDDDYWKDKKIWFDAFLFSPDVDKFKSRENEKAKEGI